jgi:hypothetical protein
MGQVVFRGRHGIGQQLQDVLAWHAMHRLMARRHDARRLHDGEGKIVAQALEYRGTQQAIICLAVY